MCRAARYKISEPPIASASKPAHERHIGTARKPTQLYGAGVVQALARLTARPIKG